MATSVAPFVSWGMWVAQCPQCPNAEKRGTCDDGSAGGLNAHVFVCRLDHGGCGYRGKVQWPDDIKGIEKLLQPRPLVNRNWRPGESLDDLLTENAEHGVRSVTNGMGHASDLRIR